MARILWPDDFDERAEEEAQLREYLSHVRVELDDGTTVPVTFITPLRLTQDLESSHIPLIADIGMIVLPEITRATMEAAVAFLAPRPYFRFFRPLVEGDRYGIRWITA